MLCVGNALLLATFFCTMQPDQAGSGFAGGCRPGVGRGRTRGSGWCPAHTGTWPDRTMQQLVGIGGGRFMALRIEAHPGTGADTQRVALYVRHAVAASRRCARALRWRAGPGRSAGATNSSPPRRASVSCARSASDMRFQPGPSAVRRPFHGRGGRDGLETIQIQIDHGHPHGCAVCVPWPGRAGRTAAPGWAGGSADRNRPVAPAAAHAYGGW